jgi:hypothetical protein
MHSASFIKYPTAMRMRFAKDMLLTEDGRRLLHVGVRHDEMRKSGLGRYSHWGSWLYFAASDNSNPNTNGRNYILYRFSDV